MSKRETDIMPSKADIDALHQFLNEFMVESDRAAVVLGTAKLDQMLEHVLKKVLQPCSGSRDELFNGEAPLSTFSAKINLAFRIGLLDAALARTLHLIRKTRNSFAHEISGCSLETGAHRDRTREIIAPLMRFEQFQRLVENCQKKWKKPTPSMEYRAVLALVAARLEGLYARCEIFIPNYIQTLIPTVWHVMPVIEESSNQEFNPDG